MFKNILPADVESKMQLLGDERIQYPDVVIDSAFDLAALCPGASERFSIG